MKIKYTENLIPKMTSNTTPIGKCKASTTYGTTWEAWKAFNDTCVDGDDCWATTNKNSWLSYEFLEPIIINKYSICPRNSGDFNTASPKNWSFEGSNNGLDWGKLDTRKDITNWQLMRNNEFIFNNNIPYKIYKINIFDNNGGYYLCVGKLCMMSKITYNKYLLKQNSNYYSIDNNYMDLGTINNDEELYNVIDEYGYDDLSILTKELNNKKVPTKLENDYYKYFDIDLNDIKDNINLIEENDKKYIEYGCNNYKISDKIKEINNAKFEILMKEY
ncbi:TPA: discoidin domain-containing protein [Clostridium botulinum]|nr:discoidin domain-containing protein [Clostridium botulinum]